MEALRPPGVPGYLPPPPPMAPTAPAPPPSAAPAPPPPGGWAPTAAWPYAFQPPRARHDDALEMLFGLITAAAVTPLGAVIGGGIGWAVAGPVGAAKGAMIGGSVPGALIAALELVAHPIRKEPVRPLAVLLPLAGPALVGVLGGVGWLIGGPVGALVALGVPAAFGLLTAFAGGPDALEGFFEFLGTYFGR